MWFLIQIHQIIFNKICRVLMNMDRFVIERTPEFLYIKYHEESGFYRTVCSGSWVELWKQGNHNLNDQKIFSLYKNEIEQFLDKQIH